MKLGLSEVVLKCEHSTSNSLLILCTAFSLRGVRAPPAATVLAFSAALLARAGPGAGCSSELQIRQESAAISGAASTTADLINSFRVYLAAEAGDLLTSGDAVSLARLSAPSDEAPQLVLCSKERILGE